MDYNKNGQYDRDDLETLITDYDNNGDRKITDAEFEFHFDMQEPTLAIVAKALFAEYDHDQDGVIDSTDLDNVHDRMDHLQDGVIDHEEFVTYYTELLTVLYILQIQSGQTPEIN
ncbi:hypothetical protein SNE40_000117 [Patella caerulea]|uniref:EF-hand domain-containing protein n=1 Tax=Patella caerulea TaxID=87958 RepID=A0AAN8KIV6_PATCE